MADWTDWIGPIGGLLGGWLGGQAGGPQTQTTTNQPNPYVMNQWMGYANTANQLAGKPYQPGVAPFSQDQYAAMDMIRGAAGGTPETRAGSQALQGFLGGANQNPYMGDNPYLQGMIDKTQGDVMNRMGTGAFGSGSFGNSGVASQTARELADAGNALRWQNYNQSANLAESGLQRQASMVPQALAYGQLPFQNASALLQSGAMQQTQGQKTLDDYLNYPYKQLQTMGSPLGMNPGGSTSSTSIPGSPWASALGGGLLGLQLGNAIGNNYYPRPTYG